MRLASTVALLGVAQIVSWGTLYYTLGVLSQDMQRDTGMDAATLFTAFSGGLLISGLLAPWVGQRIDSAGAGWVLCAGSAAGAGTMAMLALASGPAAVCAAWALGGIAMAATLYDPAFAALNQLSREHFRRAVTGLTLFGGFASTVFWPLTHFLGEALGWRNTLWIYAGLHLFLCAPIHFFLLPRRQRADTIADAATERPPSGAAGPHTGPLVWLAVSFSAASAVVAVVGVHMVSLLTATGLDTAQAVLAGMLMGPAQVVGRLVELGLLSRVKASVVGLLAMFAMLVALVGLAFWPGFVAMAIFFVCAYGLGNGVLTIVRGTAPAEMIGTHQLGRTLGQLSRPAMIAKAIAPGGFAALIAAGFAYQTGILLLAGSIAIALLGLVLAANSAARNRLATQDA